MPHTTPYTDNRTKCEDNLGILVASVFLFFLSDLCIRYTHKIQTNKVTQYNFQKLKIRLSYKYRMNTYQTSV